MQFVLFLPQMRMGIDQLVERAGAAEGAGFHGLALMDHLAPPAALDQPMYEAMTAATWLAAHTSASVSSMRLASSGGVNTSSLERFAMHVSTSGLRPLSARFAWSIIVLH